MAIKPENILEIDSLYYRFPDEHGHERFTLHDISFNVAEGELVALVGPSGCGKSTLLRLIAGLARPTTGDLHLASKNIAMVFQNFSLFPWLTVEENVGFGLKMAGADPRHYRHLVAEKIKEVGLLGKEKHHPRELSGGMRQRVGLARALATQPDILLMDEPFSSLDTFTADALRADVLRLWQKYGTTIIMVTHLVDEAVEMADRVIVFESNPGRIKKIIPIPLPRPRDRRSPHFYNLVDDIRSEIKL